MVKGQGQSTGIENGTYIRMFQSYHVYIETKRQKPFKNIDTTKIINIPHLGGKGMKQDSLPVACLSEGYPGGDDLPTPSSPGGCDFPTP